MHQHPRPSPRSAASASNPTTNPERSNNPRDPPPQPQRSRSSVDLASYTERATTTAVVGGGGESARTAEDASVQERELTKLNQIVQNFHTKAALMICSARANLPPAYNRNGELRQNRWFNVILDETDVLLDDLQEWKRPDLLDASPEPLVVEVYLDTSHLTQNQALVIVDDAGKRWDVADALASSTESSPRPSKGGGRHTEVVLERWTLELGDAGRFKTSDLNDQLPNVYKKGVVLFRSLYTFARFLPAWKLHKKLNRQPANAQPLKLRFRIRQAEGSLTRSAKDALFTPLCPSNFNNDDITEHHQFAPLLCSAGPLSITVDYRTNCDFTIENAEALLSSRFAGLDAGLAHRPGGGRSLPGGNHNAAGADDSDAALGAGIAGSRRARVAGGGAYGSLGTFHAPEQQRQSPISALRHRSTLSADSPDNITTQRVAPQSIPTPSPSSAMDRDYLKNPPFKAGSVASSPRTNAPTPSPSSSAPRPSSALTGTSAPKRVSLNTLPQQALRNPSMAPETAIASSGSSSPKPAPVHRYSSSFANRKRFTTTSTSSKAGESATSSGRASSSSKEPSGQLGDGSSGSARTDEDDIAAFISSVERVKDLKAFSHRKPGAPQQTVNLARFKNMTIASGELADEMSASSLVQTSLTPPSRRLSNVPGLSTSSSPSRALAHTPHIRSRLSTHSIAEEKESSPSDGQHEEDEKGGQRVQEDEDDDDDDEPFIFQQDNVL